MEMAMENNTTPQTTLCDIFTPKYGCFSNFMRFCQVTKFEQWQSAQEFEDAYFVFAGRNETCEVATPQQDSDASLVFLIGGVLAVFITCAWVLLEVWTKSAHKNGEFHRTFPNPGPSGSI